MNVQVKHNGTAITGFVIDYERVHKICTGIGSLDIEIVDTIGRTFNPWDEIDIWENGDFKVRYYVSSVEHDIPRGSIQLNCQDNSKRIVDYFIPDSYTIDYPSYNKYWIEKFLNEAGVDVIWNTSSPGTLLSNYTALGLATVYEQVISLLQMSGWYMYFDGNGKAVIGSMDIDYAQDYGSVGKTDILDILVTSNDKMLRNKALVFGAYDGYTGTNAKAAVTVHTPWNYDHNDLRTVVISNSNIKDSGTAYNMANQIVKEFARITVEKHITLWGARDFNLGTALRVTSNVWKGRGLVTTFGTSMSKQGLVTNVVLDERCPRLFGFFDFGDYVYVGFYGDGVWRKHIKYDPTWYNFSDGLTNTNITDMHINNGVFGSVAASGEMFYAIDTVPWHNIPVSGLLSSTANNIDPAVPIVSGSMTVFSGLMARAVTVDKYTNTLKFAIDNASGMNFGDYFLEHAQTTVSGIIGTSVSGAGNNFDGKRGWVVEYDVLAGDISGTSYPISLSGCYAYTVLDIDNDGTNDFVSVATSGASITISPNGFNFGQSSTFHPKETFDPRNITAYNLYDDFNEVGETLKGTAGSNTIVSFAVFNDESNSERRLVWINSSGGTTTAKELSISKGSGTLTSSTVTSSALTTNYQYIAKQSSRVYKFYTITSVTPGTGNLYKGDLNMLTWDASTNTLSGPTTLGTLTIPDNPYKGSSDEILDLTNQGMMINGIIYFMVPKLARATSTDLTNYMEFYMLKCDTRSDSVTAGLTSSLLFETSEGGLGQNWNIYSLTGSIPFLKGEFQNGSTPNYVYFIREWNQGSASGSTVLRNWIVYSMDGVTFSRTVVQETNSYTDPDYLLSGTGDAAQVNNNSYIQYYRATNGVMYVYNGLSVSITIYTDPANIPFQWKSANIYPIFGQHDDYYIAKNGSDYYWCTPFNFSVAAQVIFPTSYTYTPVKPFSTSDYYSTVMYWQLYNEDLAQNEIHRYTVGGAVTGYKITPNGGFTFSETRGQICGNFFLDYSGTASTVNSLRWLYVDNLPPITDTTIYQILRRDGTDYTLIQQEAYPLRLDISGSSPVVTVGSGESTFQSNYVYDTVLVTVEAVPSGVVASGGNAVNDYRYTMIQPTLGTLTSGLGISSTILYVSGSGIFGADALTFSGGFAQMFSIPSGEALRIETSNYGIGGQYIFVSASGATQTFYQQDPASFIFVEHNVNYPQSRATIIRLDDAI